MATIRYTRESYEHATSAWQYQQAAKAGSILRLRPGAYLVPHAEERGKPTPDRLHLARVAATAKSLGVGVIARHSAALIHGLPLHYRLIPQRVQVHRASGGAKSDWIHAYKTRHGEHEIVTRYGLQLTSLERTVRDLVRILDPRDGLSLLDAASRLGLDRNAIDLGTGNTRRLKQLVPLASERSESPLESRSRLLLREIGVPMPLEQVTIVDSAGRELARVDFWWPELGMAGEADGEVKYTTLLRPGESATDVVRAERAREQRLQRVGIQVTRWNWQDTNSSDGFRQRILDGMRIARDMPSPQCRFELRPVPALSPVDHAAFFRAV